MQVREFMTKDVATVFPEASIVQVVKLLLKKKIHSVPVVDGDNNLLGIISEKDLFSKEPACDYLPIWVSLYSIIRHQDPLSSDQEIKMSKLVAASAGDIMTENCTTVNPDTEISEVFRIFRETKFKTLPVVDKSGKVKGIISLVDIIRNINLDKIAWD